MSALNQAVSHAAAVDADERIVIAFRYTLMLCDYWGDIIYQDDVYLGIRCGKMDVSVPRKCYPHF